MMSQSESEFLLVRNKKKGTSSVKNNSSEMGDEEECSIDPDYILKRLTTLRKEIASSAFFKNACDTLKTCLNSLNQSEINQLVCFGIGAFGKCLTALHQLAFILEIIDKWQIKLIKFYDPILSVSENNILTNLGCEIIQDNCEGKYEVESITVFYLPHCPKQLTNNLLWKNWDPERLKHMILIGNSFENTLRNTPARFLKVDAEYILRSSEWAREIPLLNNFSFKDVFNDTAVHWWREGNLRGLDETVWDDHVEPIYEDSELITVELANKLSLT